MKGVIFNVLESMVIDKAGMEGWDQLLNDVEPDSKGVYTAGKSYPDAELIALVTKASEQFSIPIPDLIQAFGDYLFDQLASKYPIFLEQEKTFLGFLQSVHDVIHVEVKKLYDEPSLPDFKTQKISDTELLMEYHSPRKFCMLAEGLIAGAARHYQVKYQLQHEVCMHKGSDHCEFRIVQVSE